MKKLRYLWHKFWWNHYEKMLRSDEGAPEGSFEKQDYHEAQMDINRPKK